MREEGKRTIDNENSCVPSQRVGIWKKREREENYSGCQRLSALRNVESSSRATRLNGPYTNLRKYVYTYIRSARAHTARDTHLARTRGGAVDSLSFVHPVYKFFHGNGDFAPRRPNSSPLELRKNVTDIVQRATRKKQPLLD